MSDKCCACGEAEGRYKCPRCRTMRYCSIACSKKHKAVCTGQGLASQAAQAAAQVAVDVASRNAGPLLPAPQVDAGGANGPVLTQPQREMLDGDERVRRALTNAELREVIATIDASSDRQAALEAALASNPDLVDFVAHMLDAVGYEPKVLMADSVV